MNVKPIFYIPIIFLVIALAVFFTVSDSKRIRRLHEEFTKIQIKDSFVGKIEEMIIIKGVTFLSLENGKKVIIPTSSNYEYEKEYLDQNLEIGDLVRKASGSDTIYVSDSSEEVYFIMGKLLKKEKD